MLWESVCCVILAERGVVQLRLSNCAVSDKADIKRLYLDFGEKPRSKVSVAVYLTFHLTFWLLCQQARQSGSEHICAHGITRILVFAASN